MLVKNPDRTYAQIAAWHDVSYGVVQWIAQKAGHSRKHVRADNWPAVRMGRPAGPKLVQQVLDYVAQNPRMAYRHVATRFGISEAVVSLWNRKAGRCRKAERPRFIGIWWPKRSETR
jgi:hypothetical protein